MAVFHKKFKNKQTGEEARIPAGRYGNFHMAIRKLENYIEFNMTTPFVVHLVLTVAENVSEVHYDNVHRVMSFIRQRLKRVGSDFKYVCVPELQGRGSIHYHAVCVYSKPWVFPGTEDIQKSWGLGFVKVTNPKLTSRRFKIKASKIISYIGKYIGKGYEWEALDAKKSFTASQIPQIYKLPYKRLKAVMEKFGKARAKKFTCTFTKVFEKIEMAPLRGKVCVMDFVSAWEFIGNEEEPF
ncbi:MAG: hypothetical protein HQK96_17870 [Nitrospirae bacterium]|nr:hypothetical protein [Nitrospirota bacterium]